ncbi:MAG: hypothetical protein EBY89_02525, partial [Actinobacteria bacterium]|nr:hypothetical protein [Actinomycetota bacterium]
MYWRRPRNSTLVAIAIFVVSFGFWLGQPQPESPSSGVQFPDVSWVFVTTTVAPPVDTTVPVETTVPPMPPGASASIC